MSVQFSEDGGMDGARCAISKPNSEEKEKELCHFVLGKTTYMEDNFSRGQEPNLTSRANISTT